jgi:endonuclease-3
MPETACNTRPVPRPSPSKRVPELLEILERTYPEAHCELEYSNALELLMATILSAQCTDARVNRVTRHLFARCRTAEDYATIPQEELEKLVQPTGFFRAKARHLKECAKALLEEHAGTVPASMEALNRLPGVGRKTANVVLGDAFGTPEGVVVDTHVQRLSHRLGLSKQRTPEKIEQDLMRLAPRHQWALLSHWLIWHGRRRCDARKPDCAHCELSALCPSAGDQAAGIGRKAPGKRTARGPRKNAEKRSAARAKRRTA